MGSSDLGDDLDESFVDVLDGGSVAIVVEVDLDEGLRILGESEEDGEDGGLLLDGGSSHLEDGEEDLVEEDFDLFL